MSIYPAGQCTDGAATLAPWVERYGNLGNALQWAGNWRARGGTVASSPSVGSVACFQPGCDGAFGDGHVAVVTSVTGTTFVIDEMNGPAGPGHYDNRSCAVGPCVSFLEEAAAPAPPPPPPSGGSYVHVDDAEASAIGRVHLFFEDGGAFYPFGSRPMPQGAGQPLFKWVPTAPPQNWRYVHVDNAQASAIGRAHLFYRDNSGAFVPFNPNTLPQGPGTPLYERIAA